MNVRALTCIACPIGCQLEIELNDVEIRRIGGNLCKRGADYAASEILHPVRTLTSTVRVSEGVRPLVPVKSDKPLPKELLLKCMEIINACEAKAPVRIGEPVIQNILDTGVNIVATFNVEHQQPL